MSFQVMNGQIEQETDTIPKIDKNTIYLTLGGSNTGSNFNLNYERQIVNGPKCSINLRIGLGFYNYVPEYPPGGPYPDNEMGNVYILSSNFFLGQKIKLEMNFGVVLTQKENHPPSFGSDHKTPILVNIGIRGKFPNLSTNKNIIPLLRIGFGTPYAINYSIGVGF